MPATESVADRTQGVDDVDRIALSERLRDVIVVTTAPFDADLRVDLAALEQHVGFLTDSGLSALTVNTGEFYALTVDEPENVVERTVDVAGDKATVIAGLCPTSGRITSTDRRS